MDQLEFLNEIKQRVIIAILADDDLGERLVLKGGNLLQFAYELTGRASKDVDISVDGEFPDVEALKARVEYCLTNAFAEQGFVVFDFKFREVPAQVSDDIKAFWGGYQCEFKLIGKARSDAISGDVDRIRREAPPLDSSGSTKFKIDFSKHEFCGDKEEFIIDGFTIFGYSPRMFVAEKLRAICQQMPEYAEVIHRNRPAAARARDFVDIHIIVEHYGIDFGDADFHEVVQKTFEYKRVPIELIGKIRDSRDHHEPDFASVKETVHADYDLQEFGFYFDAICGKCSALEPLWRV